MAKGGRLFSFGDAAEGVFLILKARREPHWRAAPPGTGHGALPVRVRCWDWLRLCAPSATSSMWKPWTRWKQSIVETESVNEILRQRSELCMQAMRMMCEELSALKQTRKHMPSCGKHGCALHGSCQQACGLE